MMMMMMMMMPFMMCCSSLEGYPQIPTYKWWNWHDSYVADAAPDEMSVVGGIGTGVGLK
jgi:hypothetical protein